MTRPGPELLRSRKEQGVKIVSLTAYDFMTARLEEQAGVDFILVGDSIGMAMLGHPDTLGVTMDLMVTHTLAVSRGAPDTLVVGDLPVDSYEASDELAVASARRFVEEGGAGAVKFEGGGPDRISRAKAIIGSGIPFMGHIGLLPQSVRLTGGYRVVYSDQREQMLEEAAALEAVGAFAMVLEGMEEELAGEITASVLIPTIGIGAGRLTDGQILVVNDMLGLSGDFHPRFMKRFAELDGVILEAVGRFASEVRDGEFPGEEHTYRPRGEK